MAMAAPAMSNDRLSIAMERTGQWVFSQDIPTDVAIEVGEANFSLHKFMLVAKSNYIRKLVMESDDTDLTRIDLSDIPGGPEIFEKAAKFCYGVNFEITVHNVAALRCAAEYLQMTDHYCTNNLAGRTDDFLTQVALTSLSGAIVVLKSCEDLLPMADDLKIVQRCVDVASLKACNEANFPSRSPTNWWTEELTILDVKFFGKIITVMKQRGAKSLTLASAIITYTERVLRDLVRDHSASGIKSSLLGFGDDPGEDPRIQQRELLQSIVALLPAEKAAFPINFLCCLLRSAIFLKASAACKNELEKRISVILEHVTVDDLLVLSFTYDGERLLDLDSVRRILSGFVEKEDTLEETLLLRSQMAATLTGLSLSAAAPAVSPVARASPMRRPPVVAAVSMKPAAPWVGRRWGSTAARRAAAVVVRSAPESLEDKVAESIKNAEEACAGDPVSGECVAAWDEVEELSAAASHARDKKKASSDPLENYCKDNPETEECRTYDN